MEAQTLHHDMRACRLQHSSVGCRVRLRSSNFVPRGSFYAGMQSYAAQHPTDHCKQNEWPLSQMLVAPLAAQNDPK